MAEHDANLFMPDFTLADFQPVLPFLYGFANDSTLIKGQLVDCLMFGKFSDNLPKTLKKETENLMGNAKVKQEPTWAMDTNDGHVGEPLSQNVSYGYGEYGDENDENCLNCGGTGKIEEMSSVVITKSFLSRVCREAGMEWTECYGLWTAAE